MDLTLHENTLEMIQGYVDDVHCLELLQFFGKYSNARFNRLAIIHGLYDGRAHSLAHILEKSLKRLVEDKFIHTAPQNGIILYSLTDDKKSREMIREFAAIDSQRLHTLINEKRTVCKKQPSPDIVVPNKKVIFPGSIILRTAVIGIG